MDETSVQAETGRRRRAETRQRLLAAAQGHLASGDALVDLSVAALSQSAGLSRATFYLHYEDKRELIADLAATELSEWRDIIAPLIADPTADRAVVRASVDNALRLWELHGPVLAGIIELTSYDEEARAAWQGTIEAIAAELALVLAQRDSGGGGDYAMRARVIMWSTLGCLTSIPLRTKREADHLAAALTELAWGLVAPCSV